MEIDFGSEDIRRMPVYLLLDVSGSMSGAPIQAVEQGVQLLHNALLNQPQAVELAHLSVIIFGSKATQTIPLTPLLQFSPPKLSAGGATALGGALQVLGQALDQELILNTPERKGDYKPLIFLLTDGEPTDNWQSALADLKARDQKKVGNIIALGCGDAVNTSTLRQITEQVLLMVDVTPDNIRAFFQWVSASITVASQSVAAVTSAENRLRLPPPPSGFEVIL